MSSKRDPVVAVLKYFQEAELPLALQALALAQQVVRARRTPSNSRPRPVVKKPPSAVAGASGE